MIFGNIILLLCEYEYGFMVEQYEAFVYRFHHPQLFITVRIMAAVVDNFWVTLCITPKRDFDPPDMLIFQRCILLLATRHRGIDLFN